MVAQAVPLWLDIKTEYIDDNFETLLEYLRSFSRQKVEKDSFYKTTIQLLEKRAEELRNEITHRTLFADESTKDKDYWRFAVRLMGAMLLTDESPEKTSSLYVTLIYALSRLAPSKYADELLGTTFTCITNELTACGFSWDDIDKDFSEEVLAYKIINNTRFRPQPREDSNLQGRGTMLMHDGKLNIIPAMLPAYNLQKNNYNASLSRIDGRLNVLCPQNHRLKDSEQTDIQKLRDFGQWMTDQLEALRPKAKKKYAVDSEMTVRITSMNYGAKITVVTTDKDYEQITGTLELEPSILYYYKSQIQGQLMEGDTFKARLTDDIKNKFSIFRTFPDFMVRYSHAQESTNLLSWCIDVTATTSVWLTEFGTVLYSRTLKYKKGDYAFFHVSSYGTGTKYGCIYGEVEDDDEEFEFIESDVRTAFVREFARSAEEKEDKTGKHLDRGQIDILLRQMFFHQKIIVRPSERYSELVICVLMAVLLDRDTDKSYITFAGKYLRELIKFTRGEEMSITSLVPDDSFAQAESVSWRMQIVHLLQEYGNTSESEYLSEVIETSEDETLVKIAKLIQSSNRISGIIQEATQNIIKREIMSLLTLSSDNETDLDSENGDYLGTENRTQEFKTSFVYPPNNQMQASPTVQKKNVLKGVCAFLNTNLGGTLYLGVNDLGYVVGIENDMQYLKCKTIDAYTRYIQDEIKQAFGLDVLMNIEIRPMYDDKVVAIIVTPNEYHIVKLDGEAYIRVNNESRILDKSLESQILQRKMSMKNSQFKNINALHEAMEDRRKVILHGYASSNSGSVADRTVEPYELFPGRNLVVCYDNDKNGVRVFNLSRIGNVEILEERWTCERLHTGMSIDLFHMTGDKPIHIGLELDMMAKNLLVEEYPDSVQSITKTNGDNCWYFDTDVYSLEGIGRFYVGLANHIRIMDGEPLKAYVKDYLKYLQV